MSNTRTSTALEKAGIARSEWYGTNQTGRMTDAAYGKVQSYESMVNSQLRKNYPNSPTGRE